MPAEIAGIMCRGPRFHLRIRREHRPARQGWAMFGLERMFIQAASLPECRSFSGLRHSGVFDGFA